MTTYTGRDFWEAHIPRWPTVQLKTIAKLGTGHTPSRSHPEYWENCTIPWVTTEDLTTRSGSGLAPLIETGQKISELGLANSAAVLHPPGTVMLSRTASIGHSAIIGRPMATTQAFVTWTSGPRLDPRYLLAVLRAMRPEFDRLAYGSTHLTIYMPDVEQLRIPLPPLADQRAIADFLETETARIDGLIAKKRQMGLGLAERRVGLSRWLLAGPEVPGPRQPGPGGWLESVPAEWNLVRVGRLFEVQLGRMLNQERAMGSHLRPYLRNANVGWGRIDTTDVARMDFPPSEQARYRLHPGDLLVCEGGAGVAESAVWRGELEECYYQKSLHRVRPRTQLPVEWLAEWLRLWKASGAHAAEGNVATIPHLTAEQLRDHRIPVPPPGEAKRRLAELGRQERIGKAVNDALARQVRLLREHRQALITAAVCGKLEVPGVAA